MENGLAIFFDTDSNSKYFLSLLSLTASPFYASGNNSFNLGNLTENSLPFNANVAITFYDGVIGAYTYNQLSQAWQFGAFVTCGISNVAWECTTNFTSVTTLRVTSYLYNNTGVKSSYMPKRPKGVPSFYM